MDRKCSRQVLEETCAKAGWSLDLETRQSDRDPSVWVARVQICSRDVCVLKRGLKKKAEDAACQSATDAIRPQTISGEGESIASRVVDAWLHNTQEQHRQKFGKGVLAGIVMKSPQEDTVVSLGCGTSHQPPSEDDIQRPSAKLFDCHAEVLARRAFVSFLLHEMEKSLSGDSQVLLRSEQGWTVRPGISFHLFISSLPCGDAACCLGQGQQRESDELVVDIHDVDSAEQPHWPQFGRSSTQGHLRAKMDTGESLTVLTDDNITDSRLCKMTCSDKVLRWNVLGMQGAVLSHAMPPIYLSSITVGDDAGYSHSHLARAVCCRAGPVAPALQSHAHGFTVNHPALHRSSRSWPRAGHGERSSGRNLAAWWSAGQGHVQVFEVSTNASEPATEGADPSNAVGSLQEFADRFGHPRPHYELLARDGPDHSPTFRFQVQIPGMAGMPTATGSAGNKPEAKAAAARGLLAAVRERVATSGQEQAITQQRLFTHWRRVVQAASEQGVQLPVAAGASFEEWKAGSAGYSRAKATLMRLFAVKGQPWLRRGRSQKRQSAAGGAGPAGEEREQKRQRGLGGEGSKCEAECRVEGGG